MFFVFLYRNSINIHFHVFCCFFVNDKCTNFSENTRVFYKTNTKGDFYKEIKKRGFYTGNAKG